jgi:hypothetical protein
MISIVGRIRGRLSFKQITRRRQSQSGLQFNFQRLSWLVEMRERLATNLRKFAAPVTLLLVLVVIISAHAQFRGGGRGRGRRFYEVRDPERLKEQEMMSAAIDPAFTNDVFTFPRLKFKHFEGRGGFGGGRLWDDDAPDADLNLIFRLFQVTSMKVRPGLNFIDISVADLPEYPFVYMAAGGRVVFDEDEASALRSYLLSGGFLMVDDFWGDTQYEHFYEEIKKVFPDREPVELGLEHPIFHSVYQFKKEPQIPSVGTYLSSGLSYDYQWDFDKKNHDPHYFAILDDKQRIMVLACHNNHFGDGWEHEGDNDSYFDTFSMPLAYPMFLNIITYAMEH